MRMDSCQSANSAVFEIILSLKILSYHKNIKGFSGRILVFLGIATCCSVFARAHLRPPRKYKQAVLICRIRQTYGCRPVIMVLLGVRCRRRIVGFSRCFFGKQRQHQLKQQICLKTKEQLKCKWKRQTNSDKNGWSCTHSIYTRPLLPWSLAVIRGRRLWFPGVRGEGVAARARRLAKNWSDASCIQKKTIKKLKEHEQKSGITVMQ